MAPNISTFSKVATTAPLCTSVWYIRVYKSEYRVPTAAVPVKVLEVLEHGWHVGRQSAVYDTKGLMLTVG